MLLSLLLVTILTLHQASLAVSINLDSQTNSSFQDNPDAVVVSPKCATVLLVGCGVVGAAAAATVLPAVLYIIGFSSEGVLAGSFAASWQAVMPIIARGSLFSLLQSTAAGGMGSAALISSAVIGSTAGVLLLEKTCPAIDKIPAGSVEQSLVDTIANMYALGTKVAPNVIPPVPSAATRSANLVVVSLILGMFISILINSRPMEF